MPTRKSPIDKIAALQDKLKAAKAQAKIADQKRYAVLGETISAIMAQDPAFHATVAEKLKAVTNARNKADLAVFLVPSTDHSTASS